MKKKKVKKAVALGYDKRKNSAPEVLASGKGLLADKVIAVAKKHGIPIHEDADLVEVLSSLNLNEEVPEDLYVVIAEILAFVYKINGLKDKT